VQVQQNALSRRFAGTDAPIEKCASQLEISVHHRSLSVLAFEAHASDCENVERMYGWLGLVVPDSLRTAFARMPR
jgi:hypothetical protein